MGSSVADAEIKRFKGGTLNYTVDVEFPDTVTETDHMQGSGAKTYKVRYHLGQTSDEWPGTLDQGDYGYIQGAANQTDHDARCKSKMGGESGWYAGQPQTFKEASFVAFQVDMP